jgi:hypothetical protein
MQMPSTVADFMNIMRDPSSNLLADKLDYPFIINNTQTPN